MKFYKMKLLIRILIISSLNLTLLSCALDDNQISTCEVLNDALLEFNIDKVNSVLNEITEELTPSPTIKDLIGHRQNISTLIEKLGAKCSRVQFKLVCYACEISMSEQAVIQVISPETDDIEFVAYMYARISPLEPIAIVQINNAIPEE